MDCTGAYRVGGNAFGMAGARPIYQSRGSLFASCGVRYISTPDQRGERDIQDVDKDSMGDLRCFFGISHLPSYLFISNLSFPIYNLFATYFFSCAICLNAA